MLSQLYGRVWRLDGAELLRQWMVLVVSCLLFNVVVYFQQLFKPHQPALQLTDSHTFALVLLFQSRNFLLDTVIGNRFLLAFLLQLKHFRQKLCLPPLFRLQIKHQLPILSYC